MWKQEFSEKEEDDEYPGKDGQPDKQGTFVLADDRHQADDPTGKAAEETETCSTGKDAPGEYPYNACHGEPNSPPSEFCIWNTKEMT